jgi:hypothetical protein
VVILGKNSGQKQIGYRLNLEDIQYDYAGKYDPFVTIFLMKTPYGGNPSN